MPSAESMISRSYAPTHPPQQETPGAMPGQDLIGYKSDAQAYPTPQQTSPLSQLIADGLIFFLDTGTHSTLEPAVLTNQLPMLA